MKFKGTLQLYLYSGGRSGNVRGVFVVLGCGFKVVVRVLVHGGGGFARSCDCT